MKLKTPAELFEILTGVIKTLEETNTFYEIYLFCFLNSIKPTKRL